MEAQLKTTYYPFGLTIDALSWERDDAVPNRYLYNGKELEDELELNVYAYEFRSYDPALGRWWQPDPVIKEYESPYAWNTNNPIRYMDILGLDSAEANSDDRNALEKFAGNSDGLNIVKGISSMIKDILGMDRDEMIIVDKEKETPKETVDVDGRNFDDEEGGNPDNAPENDGRTTTDDEVGVDSPAKYLIKAEYSQETPADSGYTYEYEYNPVTKDWDRVPKIGKKLSSGGISIYNRKVKNKEDSIKYNIQ